MGGTVDTVVDSVVTAVVGNGVVLGAVAKIMYAITPLWRLLNVYRWYLN